MYLTYIVHDFKKVRCQACHMELYFNPGTAVCALLTNDKDELLVVIRAHEPEKGMWDLPGGFVDPGETAEQAVHREISEELNIEVQDLNYLCSAANTRSPAMISPACVHPAGVRMRWLGVAANCDRPLPPDFSTVNWRNCSAGPLLNQLTTLRGTIWSVSGS